MARAPLEVPIDLCWETLRNVGLEDIAVRDAAAFQAEYRAIATPVVGEEQAEEFTRGLAELVPRAYFWAHVTLEAAKGRREITEAIRIHQAELPRGKVRRQIDRLFQRVERIAQSPTPPKEVAP